MPAHRNGISLTYFSEKHCVFLINERRNEVSLKECEVANKRIVFFSPFSCYTEVCSSHSNSRIGSLPDSCFPLVLHGESSAWTAWGPLPLYQTACRGVKREEYWPVCL